MSRAEFAGQFDVALVVLWAFIGFIVALFFHLCQENKREGYPLIDTVTGDTIDGFPPPPAPKRYNLMDGTHAILPHGEGRTNLALKPAYPFPGAPYAPTGNPLVDGVGPASYGAKRDVPLTDWNGENVLAPLRILKDWTVAKEDPDPRGMRVLDADGVPVGQVADLWLDSGTKILRYLEIELTLPDGPPRAMLAIYYADIYRHSRQIRVPPLFASDFALFPQLRNPDQITALEEDRVSAYAAGGYLYNKQRKHRKFA